MREALPAVRTPKLAAVGLPESVVIIGGGAAGNIAAVTLRRQGYRGPVTILSADQSRPYDRPSLSKEYLAGAAKAAWLPLRSAKFYADHDIEVRCSARVIKLDRAQKTVTLSDGSQVAYGALLLATGAEPVRLAVPGATLPHVEVLRFTAVPLFWTREHDMRIRYVGHAEHSDRIDVDGDPAARDCMATYWRNDKRLARGDHWA